MGSLGLTVSQEAVTSFITWDGATASGTREPTLTCEPPLTCCGSLWKAGGRAGVATLVFRDCTFPASPTRSGLPFWGPSPWPRQLRPRQGERRLLLAGGAPELEPGLRGPRSPLGRQLLFAE